MYDLNDAQPQMAPMGELIPDGAFAKVKMTVRPGGLNGATPMDAGLLKASQSSDAKLLDCEFTVVSGPYVRRKFWQNFTVAGGKLDEKGQSKGWNISKSTFRAMVDSALTPPPRPWSDADDVRCAEWLQRREINVSPAMVSRSVGAVAREIRVHPVRDYLSQLRWDGVPRLERWTITHLGAEDTQLNRIFGARWMISAVARIMQSGVKADHMLILEGPQGAKKSSAIKTLAGADWFTDEIAEIGSKDAAQQMRGVWIIEIAELDAISRAEVSRIKAFLTRTTDRYRPPYERYIVTVPRQCVFAGSVNPDTYLRDETGNRRFWPVLCGSIDLVGLTRDRDQLWAEAVARYRDGAIWWLDEPELVASAKAEQEQRYQSDAWDALIERWLVYERRRVSHGYGNFDEWRDEEVERSSPLSDTSVGEILKGALAIDPARWTRADQMRVSAFLKSRGWERYQARIGSSREWRYRKPPA